MAGAICLIDADIIAYSMASIGQEDMYDENEEYSGTHIHSFNHVASGIDNRVYEILDLFETEEARLYLTGDNNFRFDVAHRKPYKGNRKQPKPYHLENARVYIRSRFDTQVSDGCEADDLMAIDMTSLRKEGKDCILCTIDKDLLQVDGRHYGWEGWNFPERPVHLVEGLGYLEKRGKKVYGEGFIFFCYQVLVGDTTDNIPGLPGVGPKGALDALCDAVSDVQAFKVVRAMYEEKYAENAAQELLEQCQLLWMVRERLPDGSLKHFRLEDYEEESTKD